VRDDELANSYPVPRIYIQLFTIDNQLNKGYLQNLGLLY
jgi:hypothetical protein